MFFSSIKEINKKQRKEINRLLSKGMSNIYLKVTIEKSWQSQHFDFLSLKNLLLGQFLGSSNSRRYKTSCWNLKISTLGGELCSVWSSTSTFSVFWFWKFYVLIMKKNLHFLFHWCSKIRHYGWKMLTKQNFRNRSNDHSFCRIFYAD